jgi:hypothetical protein
MHKFGNKQYFMDPHKTKHMLTSLVELLTYIGELVLSICDLIAAFFWGIIYNLKWHTARKPWFYWLFAQFRNTLLRNWLLLFQYLFQFIYGG